MSIRMQDGALEVLLVDDNPGDVRLTRELLNEGRIPVALSVVDNGVEALEYLRAAGKYRAARRPNLILLDLNLPRKDGREVLQELKQDPELKRIPVVILTSSQAEDDVRCSYDLHANGYVAKPVGLAQFTAAVRAIESFWLEAATLPGRHRA